MRRFLSTLAFVELALLSVIVLSSGALGDGNLKHVGLSGGTRGARFLSLVDPKVEDKSKSSSSSGADSSSSSSQPMTRGVSPEATKMLGTSTAGGSTGDFSKPAPSDSASSKSSSPSTQSSAKSTPTKSASNSTGATKPLSSNNSTAMKPSNATKPALMPSGNSTGTVAKPTASTKAEANDNKAKGNSNATKSTAKSTKQNVTDPVIDDVSQLLDDDQTYNATRGVLPPEKEPPTSWPLAVFGIFMGAAIILFAATAYKSYRKRKTYTAVPSSKE